MSDFPAPEPPYLGPAAHTSGSGNKPINRIVIHSTVSPCTPGGARRIAEYFRSANAGGSAHYVVDPAEVVQVVYDDTIAWHAPPNQHSLGIEMCDMPTTENGFRWDDWAHVAMLEKVAELTAQLCLAYDVPPWFVGRILLKLGRKGVTTHNEVSQAFGESSHWDPGTWPRRKFMKRVRQHYRRLKTGS